MEVLTLALVGGLLALDGTAAGQFMVSRPLVSATVAGVLIGSPVSGLAAGSVLELFYAAQPHVGGVRFSESAPAGVTAAVVAAAVAGPGGLVAGTVAGLVVGDLGGRTVIWIRALNARLAPDAEVGPVSPSEVTRAHLAGIGVDYLRGTAVTALGVGIGPIAAGWLPPWPFGRLGTVALLVIAAAVPLGILYRSFSGARRRLGLTLLGVGVGAAMGLL